MRHSSDLFTAIGTTFGAGDGSSTFNVPDLRGEFLRGWDDSRGIDSSRAFGSAQTDQMESHRHVGGFAGVNGNSAFGVTSTGYGNVNSQSGQSPSNHPNTSTVGGTSNSSETRPRNIALLACIKY